MQKKAAEPRTFQREHIEEWRAFCAWLTARPRRSAYVSAMPPHFQWLVTSSKTHGGDRDGLVFYSPGWGWRLRLGWKDELARRESPNPNAPGALFASIPAKELGA